MSQMHFRLYPVDKELFAEARTGELAWERIQWFKSLRPVSAFDTDTTDDRETVQRALERAASALNSDTEYYLLVSVCPHEPEYELWEFHSCSDFDTAAVHHVKRWSPN